MKIQKPINALPEGVLLSDLSRPKNREGFTDWDKLARVDSRALEFELWYTQGFGWCIPTLHISNGNRTRGGSERTYAVRVRDAAVVRIGAGPHVTERHIVYVKKTRQNALAKYLDMKTQGEVGANTVRDRISSRRAQGAINRARGLTSWNW